MKKVKGSEVGALETLIYVGQTREIHSIKLINPGKQSVDRKSNANIVIDSTDESLSH